MAEIDSITRIRIFLDKILGEWTKVDITDFAYPSLNSFSKYTDVYKNKKNETFVFTYINMTVEPRENSQLRLFMDKAIEPMNFAVENNFKFFLFTIFTKDKKYIKQFKNFNPYEYLISIETNQDNSRRDIRSLFAYVEQNFKNPDFARCGKNEHTCGITQASFINIGTEKAPKHDVFLKYVELFDSRPFISSTNDSSAHVVNNNVIEIVETNNLEPKQIIYYGVPGCGKSHKISELLKDKNEFNIFSEEEQIIRTVFHPDYTNSDFVGQIFPESDGSNIKYVFKPGPFSEILARALIHPENQYALIIEEINRGNSASIFGEIFQLLDRLETGSTKSEEGLNTYGKGWSEYFFMNDSINEYIRKEASTDGTIKEGIDISNIHFSINTGIRLPPNLSLLATMNTSDQNVFTLDNAFQRRWNMEYISNKLVYENANEKQKAQFNATIGNTQVTWGKFRDEINKVISAPENSFSNAEDKQLGLFFIKAEDKMINEKDFVNKVLKYLWNDVFKRDKSVFNSDNVSTFGDLLDAFKNTDAFEKCFSSDFVSKIIE